MTRLFLLLAVSLLTGCLNDYAAQKITVPSGQVQGKSVTGEVFVHFVDNIDFGYQGEETHTLTMIGSQVFPERLNDLASRCKANITSRTAKEVRFTKELAAVPDSCVHEWVRRYGTPREVQFQNYETAEVSYKGPWEITHPSGQFGWVAEIRGLEPLETEVRITQENGMDLYRVDVTVFPLEDKSFHVKQSFSVGRDAPGGLPRLWRDVEIVLPGPCGSSTPVQQRENYFAKVAKYLPDLPTELRNLFLPSVISAVEKASQQPKMVSQLTRSPCGEN